MTKVTKKSPGRPRTMTSKAEAVQVRFTDALQRRTYLKLSTEQRVQFALEHAKTLALHQKQ